jgi:hypothetical protein
MRQRTLLSAGVAAVVLVSLVSVSGQSPPTAGQKGQAPKTSWGDPDLQGIWDTTPLQIPLQRSTKNAGKEFFTDAEIAELNAKKAKLPGKETRSVRGTEVDVAGAYNAVFNSFRYAGRRTSLIVDPPDGRIPPLTPAVQKRNADFRALYYEFVRSTDTCKNKWPGCDGGTYNPVPSPKRLEPLPSYPAGNLLPGGGHINRSDGPEDRGPSERCMTAILPDFGGFRQIVQSPGSVSIFYDTGQGQSWHRIIPVDGSSHLPQSVRLSWGDSRGRW